MDESDEYKPPALVATVQGWFTNSARHNVSPRISRSIRGCPSIWPQFQDLPGVQSLSKRQAVIHNNYFCISALICKATDPVPGLKIKYLLGVCT